MSVPVTMSLIIGRVDSVVSKSLSWKAYPLILHRQMKSAQIAALDLTVQGKRKKIMLENASNLKADIIHVVSKM